MVLKNMAISTKQKNPFFFFGTTKKKWTSFLVKILLYTFDPLPEAIPMNKLCFLYGNPIQTKKKKKTWRMNSIDYFAIFLHIFPNSMWIFIDEDDHSRHF